MHFLSLEIALSYENTNESKLIISNQDSNQNYDLSTKPLPKHIYTRKNSIS